MAVFVLVLAALAIVPLAAAQEGPTITVSLTPYEGNPILTASEPESWIARARVIQVDGLLHMFYTAYGEAGAGVGYATSEDGLTWAKHEDSPVSISDAELAPNGVMEFGVLLDDEAWKLYFTPWLGTRDWWDLADYTLIATAQGPTGPWTIEPEPVLAADETGWDTAGRWIISVIHTDDGYRMYYESSNLRIGMATSPDGLQWTKYDDPATEDTNSDPVFAANQDAEVWDSGYVASPVVRQTEDGWEMFYGAGGADAMTRSIGYATSPDGITWTRQGDAPILSDPDGMAEPDALVTIDGTDYLYYTTYSGIAVATVTYR